MQHFQFKIFASLIFCVVSCHANSTDQAKQLLQDQEYCYALGAMANMTVLNKNSGKSFEEQMALRKKSLGENSSEYRLVEDFARQIYEKDIRNPLGVASDINKGCLESKGVAKFFVEKAFQICPAIGIMVSEVASARKNGASIEQVKALLGDRYGDLPKTYHGGTEKLAATYSENSSPENGFLNYVLCMESGRRSS